MILEQTNLKDCFVLNETLNKDSRGYFIETYNRKNFKALTGLDIEFIQDNQSRSSQGVLRGLHMQYGEAAQSKLVRVIEGVVLDVAVDLRKNSPSFGNHFSIELSQTNNKQLFIPTGFAHGFVVLSEFATFQYKVDQYYKPGYELGIRYNDPELNIDWKIDPRDIILSEKDHNLGSFKDYLQSPYFESKNLL